MKQLGDQINCAREEKMSDTAVMFFKPEFTLADRTKLTPIIRKYLTAFNLTIENTCEVGSREAKTDLFDRIYSRLLENARRQLEHGYIGAFAYLASQPGATDEHLFKEWVSPTNPALRLGDDNYYQQRDNLLVLNPFCPYQRKLFTESASPVHLFLLRKHGDLSWSEIKPLFQGQPVQSGGDRKGIRSHLSQCSWYTPTTNGLHLSASVDDAARETREVMEFFTHNNLQSL